MCTEIQQNKEQESRRSTRVTMHGDARIKFDAGGESFILPCTVSDISLTGCKAIIIRENLPDNWQWKDGLSCGLVLRKNHYNDIEFSCNLIWSQRIAKTFDAIGLCFNELDEDSFRKINQLILLRIRAGLEIHGNSSAAESSESAIKRIPLSTSLSVDAWPESGSSYHLCITEAGCRTALMKAAPRRGESVRMPAKGDVLHFGVYPPAWAEVRMRTLRFTGTVLNVTDNECEIRYATTDHDIQKMILSILPVEKAKKPDKKSYTIEYALITIAILVLWLLSQN